jgi:transposase
VSYWAVVAHKTHARDFAGLEERRKQAAQLFAKGETQAWVARQLKASRQSVSRWHQQWKSKGVEGLRAAGRAGRKRRLSPSQLGKVDAALRQGARQHGFSADLWTLPRVATVIERVTGEKFHPGHVWKILGSLEWSVQKPTQQAKERSQEKVQYWVATRWPAVKKTLGGGKPGSISKTNRGSRKSLRSGPLGRRGAKHRS